MNVISCTINPSTIALGGSANLGIIIDQPASGQGIGVIIDTDSNGSQDTLLNTPVAITISAGQTQSSYLLETSNAATNPATKIIFTAHIGSGSRRSAELDIR